MTAVIFNCDASYLVIFIVRVIFRSVWRLFEKPQITYMRTLEY